MLWSLLPGASLSAAPSSDPGVSRLGEIAVQEGGRVMPLEAYAQRLAVELTGRTRWSSNGPEGYTNREPTELLLDIMFRGQQMIASKLITIEDKPFKRAAGLDPERRFFSPAELASAKGINEFLARFDEARSADPQASPTREQRKALEIRSAANRVAGLVSGEMIPIIPPAAGAKERTFRRASAQSADPGAEAVQQAWAAIGKAHAAGTSISSGVEQLERAIAALGALDSAQARGVRLEVFYDRHHPWRMTAAFYGLAIVLFGVSRLILKRPLTLLALLCTGVGIAEHLLGIGLRVAILGRAPVSNTYEALLWMGLVGIGVGLVAQLLNKRKGWYLFAGVCAALISVIFAGMVPLTDRTNSLPAVLRSNFWLTIHVLTIVASYGVLAVASVLGHAYLIKDVLLGWRDEHSAKRSAALVVQTYRTIQVGLVLLTAGTILGGVWAAESWGRFWGWDPKETWALISILIYFAVLHARYVRWLKDFGLAAAAVLGLVVIVWTFYGVNYVMATGLHSYGFGSGGEVYVGLWALAELAFLAICALRYRALKPKSESIPSGQPARPAA